MSRQHISSYRRTLAEQHRVTGSLNERVLRKAFAELLERMGRPHDLVFTNEWEGKGPRGNAIAVDGALIPSILRKPFGFWEAKDSKDDLDRARDLEKAIRVHKAREARKRAEERQRIERERGKDRDGPGR